MSRGFNISAFARARVDGQIIVDAGPTMMLVQALAPGLAGAVDELLYDMVTHHRLSVGKHNNLPGGRTAQQWWFARSFRHASNVASKGPPPGGIGAIKAESFAAAQSGQTFGDDRFKQVEFGGVVNASQWFVIPVGSWRRRGKREELMRMLASRSLHVTPSGALIRGKLRGKTVVASEIIGVLRRARREKPMLGFYAMWEKISPKHLAGLDKVAAAAVAGTEKEIGRITRRASLNRAAGAAFTRAYAGARAEKLGPAAARQVARAAAAEARKVSRGLLVSGE